MIFNIKNNKQFYAFIAVIILIGFIIRFVNINYASMWADELYSALLANPDNSWYEVLYIQRAYQPPLYAFSLWVWVKLFAYNEFYIRLFTLLGGVACIYVSGILGKKMHSYKLGIILAVIVAFNPVQIWYSLEARFYIFVFLFSAISLLIYWITLQNLKFNWILMLVKAINDAALCYSHHFGLVFIFSQFLNDVYIFYLTKDRNLFYRKIISYAITGLLYLPWVIWGLSEAIKIQQYWLKEINILKYLGFGLQYPVLINIFFVAIILFYIAKIVREKSKYRVLVFFCVIVTIIPVIYSYVRMPLLVDRYAMVMAPVLYTLLGLSILYFLNLFDKYNSKVKLFISVSFFLILIMPGLNISFLNKKVLIKQPWREMSQWLNQQSDLDQTKIFANGAKVKEAKHLNFYLNHKIKIYNFNELDEINEDKMYFVESNSVWQISDSIFRKIKHNFQIEKIEFGNEENFGNIYVLTKKY